MHTESTRQQDDLAYWRASLAGARPVDLPVDRPRPAVHDLRASTVRFDVPAELAKAVLALGAPAFPSFLAGLYVLLARYSRQTDLVVGTQDAFLRTDLSGEPSFLELLDRVQQTLADADAHRGVTVEHLTELLPDNGLRRVVFELDSRSEVVAEVVVRLSQRPDAGFDGEIEYSTALFEQSTIEQMANGIVLLLRGAVTEPASSVHRAEMTETGQASPAERIVVQVFAEFLNIDDIGSDTDFFDVGGHSLLAFRVVARLREVFPVDLSVNDMFEAPTAAGLCGVIQDRIETRIARLTDDEVAALLVEEDRT